MTCIIELNAGSGTGLTSWRWQAGDDSFVDATVNLNEGKKASSASVVLADPVLELFAELPLPTKQSRITIDVWMSGDLGKAVPPKVFSGFVQGIQVATSAGRVTLAAADKLKGGRRRKKARIRRFSSALQFVQKIAEENDLEIDTTRADLADVEFSRVVQHGETDWQTLNRVLASAGHKPKVRGNTLYVELIGATRPTTGGAPILRGTWGGNLVDLDVQINERTAARALNVFDFKGNDVTDADADAEAVDRPVSLDRAGLALAASDFPSFTEAQVLQAKKAQARAKRVFEGTCTFGELLTGTDTDDTVVLERVGARLSGVWNIDSVSLRYTARQTVLGIYNGGAE